MRGHVCTGSEIEAVGRGYFHMRGDRQLALALDRAGVPDRRLKPAPQGGAAPQSERWPARCAKIGTSGMIMKFSLALGISLAAVCGFAQPKTASGLDAPAMNKSV